MMMNTGLSHIELSGLGGNPSDGPESAATRYRRSGLVWLPAGLIAGFGAWMLLSGYASKPAGSEPMRLATTVAAEPAPSPAAMPAPEETGPPDGLTLSSQSWRRGGLGSNAMVTFTLRNSNDYPVRDIEISCAFNRRDGSHLTDRTRIIHDIVNMKSRKTFARMHVGFVNINADTAKCSLVAARHV
jgi:hypothetical protein